MPLGTHLMITDPDRFLDEFAEAGSDSFQVPCGNPNLHCTVQRIKALCKGAGVEAGANIFVAGTAIFGDKPGVAVAMERLRIAIRKTDYQSSTKAEPLHERSKS